MKKSINAERFIAFLIDTLITSILSQLIEKALAYEGVNFPVYQAEFQTIKFTYQFSTWLFVLFLYLVIMESSRYQASIGKILFQLSVHNKNDNNKISIGTVLLRNFIKTLSIFFLGIPFLPMLFQNNNKSLHDWISKTVVRKRIIKEESLYLDEDLLVEQKAPPR